MKKLLTAAQIRSLIWIFEVEETPDTISIGYFMGRKEQPFHLIVDRATDKELMAFVSGKISQLDAFNMVELHETNKAYSVQHIDMGALQENLKDWVNSKN